MFWRLLLWKDKRKRETFQRDDASIAVSLRCITGTGDAGATIKRLQNYYYCIRAFFYILI